MTEAVRVQRRVDELVDAFRRWVEDVLPWFDRDVEAAKDAHAQSIAYRSEAAREGARVVLMRRSFRRAGERLGR
jgi:hypothetical protein